MEKNGVKSYVLAVLPKTLRDLSTRGVLFSRLRALRPHGLRTKGPPRRFEFQLKLWVQWLCNTTTHTSP